MAKKRKYTTRGKLYRKIMHYSHEMGKEITQDDVIDMLDLDMSIGTLNEVEALQSVYDKVFKEWLDHKLPVVSSSEDT